MCLIYDEMYTHATFYLYTFLIVDVIIIFTDVLLCVYSLTLLSLEWRQINIMFSQITGNRTVFSTACLVHITINIKFRIIGHRCTLTQRVSKVRLWYLICCRPEQYAEQTVAWLVIWDTIWCRCTDALNSHMTSHTRAPFQYPIRCLIVRSYSLEGARSGVKIFVSLWNLTGTRLFAAIQQSHFRAIGQF